MKRTVVQTLVVLGLAGCATVASQDTRATEAMLTALTSAGEPSARLRCGRTRTRAPGSAPRR